MISSCTSFTLPHNQLVVSVKAAACGVKAVGLLSEVWVLVDDVPAGLRSVPFLMAFGVLSLWINLVLLVLKFGVSIQCALVV